MRDTLEVLNGQGHLHLDWDPENAEEVASVREEVARLKLAGYSFFLVEDEPADEVSAGHGALNVKRIEDPTSLAYTPLGSKQPTSTVEKSDVFWPACQWDCAECAAKTYPCPNCPDCPPPAAEARATILPNAQQQQPDEPIAEEDPEPPGDRRGSEYRAWRRRQAERAVGRPAAAPGRRTVAVAPMRGGA